MKRLEDRKIHVELTDRAKDLLIAEGYDPTYGARPLKRAIQRRVLDPLAMRVLQGDFGEGRPRPDRRTSAASSSSARRTGRRMRRGSVHDLTVRTYRSSRWPIRLQRQTANPCAAARATGSCRRGRGRAARCGTCWGSCSCSRSAQAFFFSLQAGETISYSDFKQRVRDGQVQE